VLQINH